MSDINNEISAFPYGQISDSGEPIGGCFDPGMTLRDYFAAAALQGLLAGYLNRAKLDNEGALMIPNSMHAVAYKCADEMLLAREANP